MRNPIFHARTKHIEVHYHYVKERLSAGEISLAYVPTQDNLADLFTKAVSREKFEAFHKVLGLLPFVETDHVLRAWHFPILYVLALVHRITPRGDLLPYT